MLQENVNSEGVGETKQWCHSYSIITKFSLAFRALGVAILKDRN